MLRHFLLSLFLGTIVLLSSILIANDSNATNRPPSPSIRSVQTKLHIVKITSPAKGQQIPVRSNLTVSGKSNASSIYANCEVSVIVNGIKPYQKAVPTGHGGKDYSTWNYRLTPAYAAIKLGQNRITAKFSCNNPSLVSHNSVNVTGLANSNPAINASGLQPVSSPKYNNPRQLLISLGLEKNPIRAGDNETLKIRVIDAANSNVTIAGASVNGTLTDSKNATKTNFNGRTDKSGIFAYTWKISKDSKPGIFTVGVHASATGYHNRITRTAFSVNSVSEHKHKTIAQNKTLNCRLFILSTGPCS